MSHSMTDTMEASSSGFLSKFDNLDHRLFWPAIGFTFLILLSAVLFPEGTNTFANTGMKWITNEFGWFIQLAGFACLAVLLWLAFSRFGSIKLGAESDTPEFSDSSYAYMIFTAGVGAALIFWAVGEPMYYMQSPPMFSEVGSVEASQWLITFTLFHWGPIGWAIFCLPAVPFAYYLHKKKKRNLRLSNVLEDVIGKKNANGTVGYIINIIAIFGTLGAFSTSMGLTVGLIGAGINKLTGIPNDIVLQVGLIAAFIIFYAFVMFAGMKKGVAKLANACVYAAFILGLFVLISGPTAFIFSYFFDSAGVMFNNFIRMSFWSDPVQKSGFPQAWTMYYWAWYFAYLVMMGVFLARISKGRTIRQLVLTTITCGSAGAAFFIAIFGSYSVHSEINGILPVLEWMNEFGVSMAVVETINALPMGSIILVVFLFVEFFLMSTTMTSTAVSMSMMTTKELDADSDPDASVRMIWALGIGAVSMAAFFMGGSIDTIKSMCIIVGLPMIALYILMMICLKKWIKQDHPELMAK
ncbi:BCCT family transporter [Endozoicomonas gorgoniicola]|uniref:BCCT family transporter n=1 Tax=Endozoicomonas gorgoniicola TaxID=1234144 RepID=A0ABT3N158_9GAMM|nr:BCCT family transporter [Endozoicomonas gorgoniicola]MCW7555368.1 BCCT family transporter [Endozoicomonas gorgoniicola]